VCLKCENQCEDNGQPHDDRSNESRPIKHLPHLLARPHEEHCGENTDDGTKGVGNAKAHIVAKEEEDGPEYGEGKSHHEADGKALDPRTPRQGRGGVQHFRNPSIRTPTATPFLGIPQLVLATQGSPQFVHRFGY